MVAAGETGEAVEDYYREGIATNLIWDCTSADLTVVTSDQLHHIGSVAQRYAHLPKRLSNRHRHARCTCIRDRPHVRSFQRNECSSHCRSCLQAHRGHDGKEAGHLFPVLDAVGVQREGGPIGVIPAERAPGASVSRNTMAFTHSRVVCGLRISDEPRMRPARISKDRCNPGLRRKGNPEP